MFAQSWFQAEQTTEFIAWQAGIAREYASPGQFVTTCMSYDRPALDDRALAASLDVSAGNPYHDMKDGLLLPDESTHAQHWTTHGTWALYRSADRLYSSHQAPYLVMETDAQSIGSSWNNRPGYDGQWRQAAWALVSRGAETIEYWQWRSLHFGTETFWGGVLPYHGRPGRVYREIARIGAELARAGDVVTGLRPDADVAFVHSQPSRWALDFQRPLADAGGDADRRSYQAIFDAFYRGAFDAKLQGRVLHAAQMTALPPDQAAAVYPTLVAAGLYAASDDELDWLLGYAHEGGHLVLGPRTGYADPQARARPEPAPARLRAAAGIEYEEFSNLDGAVPVRAAPAPDGAPPLGLAAGAAATRWIDGLQATTAEIVARYDHRHFGRWPAVTTRAHGAGRVTTVGTVPGPRLARDLFGWCAAVAGRPRPWHPEHPSLTVTSATNQRGDRLRFVHNWSWDDATFTVPSAASDILSGAAAEPGEHLRLGPWDVRVLLEHPGPT